MAGPVCIAVNKTKKKGGGGMFASVRIIADAVKSG
jgi:hypothetical protein